MLRIIRSNLLRAYRNVLVWACVFLQFTFTFFYTLIIKLTMPLEASAEAVLPSGIGVFMIPVTGVLMIFCCVSVLSEDFDNRTVNLKIQAGYSKHEIYWANFITALVLSMTIFGTYLLTFCLISLPVLGNIAIPTDYAVAVLGVILISAIVYSALSVCIVSIFRRTLPSMIAAFAILIASIALIFYMADFSPEGILYYYDCVHAYSPEEYGEMIADGRRESLRIIAKEEFFYNFFVAGNASKISDFAPLNLWQIIPFAIVKISAFLGIGFIVSGHTNIK